MPKEKKSNKLGLSLDKPDLKRLGDIRKFSHHQSMQAALKAAIKEWHTILLWERYKVKVSSKGVGLTWRQMCEEMAGEVNEEALRCESIPTNNERLMFTTVKHNHVPHYYNLWIKNSRDYYETFQGNPDDY